MKDHTGGETNFWHSVGVPSRGAELYKALHDGLPIRVFENLATLSSMEKADLALALSFSISTFQRRVSRGRFSLEESDRLYRFATLLEAATALFEGDRVKARNWMLKPSKGIGGKKPVEMLATMAETNCVLDLVNQLENGILV